MNSKQIKQNETQRKCQVSNTDTQNQAKQSAKPNQTKQTRKHANKQDIQQAQEIKSEKEVEPNQSKTNT